MPDEMVKVSADQALDVLAQVPHTLRLLVEERDTLKEKVANYERDQRVSSLAQEMEEKNMHPGLSLQEKVAALRQESPERLESIQAAVDMAGPDMTLGSLESEGGVVKTASANSGQALVEFCLGQVDPS